MTKIITLSWEEFLSECKEFIEISEKFNDSWNLCTKHDQEGGIYLIYKNKITIDFDGSSEELLDCENKQDVVDIDDNHWNRRNSKEIVQMEYHIMYSLSYQVPVLYFQGHKADGRSLTLDECWHIFNTLSSHNLEKDSAEMLSILTQADHPILFKPFFSLHPCRTANLLAQAGKSQNRVITFLSLLGPSVGLNLRNEYGLLKIQESCN